MCKRKSRHILCIVWTINCQALKKQSKWNTQRLIVQIAYLHKSCKRWRHWRLFWSWQILWRASRRLWEASLSLRLSKKNSTVAVSEFWTNRTPLETHSLSICLFIFKTTSSCSVSSNLSTLASYKWLDNFDNLDSMDRSK